MNANDRVRLQNLVRIYARAGRWEEARRVGEILRRGSREPKTVEGDSTAW
jgi:hypothetical protein